MGLWKCNSFYFNGIGISPLDIVFDAKAYEYVQAIPKSKKEIRDFCELTSVSEVINYFLQTTQLTVYG